MCYPKKKSSGAETEAKFRMGDRGLFQAGGRAWTKAGKPQGVSY